MSLADGIRRADAGVARALVGGENRRCLERRALFVGRRGCFEFFKIPRAGNESEAGRFYFGRSECAGEEGEPSHAEAGSLASGDGRGATERRRAVRCGSQADEQHALYSALADAEVQRLVARAAKVAPRDRACQRTVRRRVDRFQLAGQRRIGGERDDEKWRVESGEIRGGCVQH